MKKRKVSNGQINESAKYFQQQISERRAQRIERESPQPTPTQIAEATEWIKRNMFGGQK